ncbi:hypothetical protein ACFE04_010171 [Oxalis oulophora]
MLKGCFKFSYDDSGKGKSKVLTRKASHGFHLVKGKSRHDMEDYHVAEYRITEDHPSFLNDLETLIRNAYQSTNNFILENSAELGMGGSTVVTAILIDGKDLLVAKIGGSRAVVYEEDRVDQLTVNHEPQTARDVPRVNGILAVARAFGDKSLKTFLTSEPHVRHFPVNRSTEFLILASDGIWKVMSNEEASELVKSIKDPKAATKRITSEALARKSKDDISCIERN